MSLTCTLAWPDGQSVEARIEPESPDAEYPVVWSGSTEKARAWDDAFPGRPQKSDAAFLEFIFKSVAARLGATVNIHREGEYERFAE